MTLHETYERILTRIPDYHQQYARTLLQWITFSARPLTITEAAEVVAFDYSQCGAYNSMPSFDPKNALRDPHDVIALCSSLVSLPLPAEKIGAQQRVQLAHASVRDYLVSEYILRGAARHFHLDATVAHCAIAHACLAYCFQFHSAVVTYEDWPLTSALRDYASQSWISHITVLKLERALPQYIMDLLEKLFDVSERYPEYETETTFHTWARMISGQEFKLGRRLRAEQDQPHPLCYAAEFGLPWLVATLLQQGVDVHAAQPSCGDALQAAASKGHADIVRILLDGGAKPDAKPGPRGTALQAASYHGRSVIVRMLLDSGVKPNLEDEGPHGHALQAACYNGNIEIIHLLLANDAPINNYTQTHGDALQVACICGHTHAVQVLLRNGAQRDIFREGLFGSALQAAAYCGHQDIVDLLLADPMLSESQIHMNGGRYGTALQAAAAGGQISIVRTLIQHGADVNAEGGKYGTALQAASARGHTDIVALLLTADAQVNMSGGRYGRALRAASYHGHADIVHLLLSNGADPDSALQAVAFNDGRNDIVKLLVDAGAKPYDAWTSDPIDVFTSSTLNIYGRGSDVGSDSSSSESRFSRSVSSLSSETDTPAHDVDLDLDLDLDTDMDGIV